MDGLLLLGRPDCDDEADGARCQSRAKFRISKVEFVRYPMPDTTDVTITVASVRGRYPGSRASLKADTIEAFTVQSGPDEYLIRLDDHANPSMWLELRITVRGKS